MRKSEWIITIVLAIALGLGMLLALSGNPLSQAAASNPQATATSEDAVVPTISVEEITPTASAQPDGTPLEPAGPAGADLDDALLLYSDILPSNFSVNFCAVAAYYGLGCKKISLDAASLTDAILRDGNGEYFELIGLDATLLQQGRNFFTADELNLLINLVNTERVDLLISKIEPGVSSYLIATLTEGAVSGARQVEDLDKDWRIAADRPEVTREFSGQTVIAAQASSSPTYGLIVADPSRVANLITSHAAAGEEYPVFAEFRSQSGSIFLDAGEDSNNLEQIPMREMVYSAARFTQIMPLMMTLRYAFSDEAWHNPKNYANLTIDRGTLTEATQGVNYTALLYFMKVHNYHTTVALIPAYWELSAPHVIAMFVTNPDYFSLAQYGNNADGYEFYYYNDEEIDRSIASILPARPFEEQEWDILEGMARMEMHRSLTLIPYDRVMVFPFGISPEPTLAYLKRTNYLAAVTDDDIPLGAALPTAPDYGMYPAVMDYGNFPILTRRLPAETQAYQPYLLMSLMDLFIDRPALFYTYPFSEGLFPGEMDAFNPIADELNQLPGGVEWASLGDILRHLYLEKLNDDGSRDVRIYSREIILENDGTSPLAYHVTKPEALNVPIARLTVNGHEFPYQVRDGILSLDVLIPAGQSAWIEIVYDNTAP